MTTLYVAVVRVDDKYSHNFRGPIADLRNALDDRIISALGFRGRIQGSEIVESTPEEKKRTKVGTGS